MNIIKRKLRPSGNAIRLDCKGIDHDIFHPYTTKYYQSGTSALAAAIITSINIKSIPGEQPEVIIPAYCCPDIISAIIYAKAKPVLVDLELDRPWMSINEIEKKITKNTVAIIAINFLGIMENIRFISNLCNQNDILLIEDSAQGFPLVNPVEYWRGDLIVLSFGRGKPVSLLHGGALLTTKNKYSDVIPSQGIKTQNFNSLVKYLFKVIIYNSLINPYLYRLLTLLPGINIGNTEFKKLNEQTGIDQIALKNLKSNIDTYNNRRNTSLEIMKMLATINSPLLIDLVSVTKHDLKQPLLRYPILIKNKKLRDIIATKLELYGSSLMYKVPLKNIEGVDKYLDHNDNNQNNSIIFSQNLITIPTHCDVKSSDIMAIKYILIENLMK